MNTIYDKLDNIDELLKYRIHEGNIGYFDANIIYAINKISDIYFTYCSARANLYFLSNKDFGDFASDDISKLYNKVLLVNNALFHYNVLIDLSWQFVWLVYCYECFGQMPTTKMYEELCKQCTKDKLELRLTLAHERKIRDYYIRNFFEESLIIKLREKYNFIKHRGTYYYQGLGMNYKDSAGLVNGYSIPLIYREEIDVDDLKENLLDLDLLFSKYFFGLVQILIPKNFIKTNNVITSMTSYYFTYENQIKKYCKKIRDEK